MEEAHFDAGKRLITLRANELVDLGRALGKCYGKTVHVGFTRARTFYIKGTKSSTGVHAPH
jgi:hypothetical protein